VRDSIVMFDSVIRSGAVVDRAILDKEVTIGPGAIIGEGADMTIPNRQEPGRLFTGITVIGKRAIVPRGVRIGRNVKIGGDVRAADFATRVVKSGSTVERHQGRARRAPAVSAISDDREAESSRQSAAGADGMARASG